MTTSAEIGMPRRAFVRTEFSIAFRIIASVIESKPDSCAFLGRPLVNTSLPFTNFLTQIIQHFVIFSMDISSKCALIEAIFFLKFEFSRFFRSSIVSYFRSLKSKLFDLSEAIEKPEENYLDGETKFFLLNHRYSIIERATSTPRLLLDIVMLLEMDDNHRLIRGIQPYERLPAWFGGWLLPDDAIAVVPQRVHTWRPKILPATCVSLKTNSIAQSGWIRLSTQILLFILRRSIFFSLPNSLRGDIWNNLKIHHVFLRQLPLPPDRLLTLPKRAPESGMIRHCITHPKTSSNALL